MIYESHYIEAYIFWYKIALAISSIKWDFSEFVDISLGVLCNIRLNLKKKGFLVHFV